MSRAIDWRWCIQCAVPALVFDTVDRITVSTWVRSGRFPQAVFNNMIAGREVASAVYRGYENSLAEIRDGKTPPAMGVEAYLVKIEST